MRERQLPRREKPRPEGVGPDWLTKKQAMDFANIASDYLFRRLASEVVAAGMVEIVEEGKARPTWVSPEFAQALKALHAIPERDADVAEQGAPLSEKQLIQIVGCGTDYISAWVAACPPSEQEAQLMRGARGQTLMYYSSSYAERLRVFKEAHPELKVRPISRSEIMSHAHRVRFNERCIALQQVIQANLEATAPEKKHVFRQIMNNLNQLMTDVAQDRISHSQIFFDRLEAIQEAVDTATDSVVSIKKAAPAPNNPQQLSPTVFGPSQPNKRQEPALSSTAAEHRHRLRNIATCERFIDHITTAQMGLTLPVYIKQQLPELRFAFETFRGKLQRGESIDQSVFARTMKKAQALLEGEDRDDD